MVGGKHACDCDGTCCEKLCAEERGRRIFQQFPVSSSHTISIDCEAVKCIYNSNYKCVAGMWTSRAAEPATAERPPVLLLQKNRKQTGKQNHQIRLDKSLQNADNKASDRIRRETAGT